MLLWVMHSPSSHYAVLGNSVIKVITVYSVQRTQGYGATEKKIADLDGAY